MRTDIQIAIQYQSKAEEKTLQDLNLELTAIFFIIGFVVCFNFLQILVQKIACAAADQGRSLEEVTQILFSSQRLRDSIFFAFIILVQQGGAFCFKVYDIASRASSVVKTLGCSSNSCKTFDAQRKTDIRNISDTFIPPLVPSDALSNDGFRSISAKKVRHLPKRASHISGHYS